jgi:hypothetical protein
LPLTEFQRRLLAELAGAPLDLQAMKATWLAALDQADAFVRSRPPEEAGCLYYSPAEDTFKLPLPGVSLEAQGLVPHYGEPGGVLPRLAE